MKTEILRLENIVRNENGAVMLNGFYLHIFKGEILGLISDNVYQKQNIMGVLCGNLNIDVGRIYFYDKHLQPDEYASVCKNKVTRIDNQSRLSQNLTVAENIFVIRGGFKKYIVNKKILRTQASMLLKQFDVSISADEIVQNLSAFERITIELIKAHATGNRLIILCDLAGFLSSIEIEKLYKLVIRMKELGTAFLIIEDYDDILFKFADRLAVVRNGQTARVFNRKDFNKATVHSLLMEQNPKQRENIAVVKNGPKVLEFENVCTENLSNANFCINQGEVASILYMDDGSYEDVLNLLKGEMQVNSGNILLCGKEFCPRGLYQAIEKRVCFIDEHPILNMLFYDMSVMDNLCFTMSNKVRGLWLKRRYKRSIYKAYYERFGESTRNESLDGLDAETLQTLIYCKWGLYSPKLVVCVKPFSTVDLNLRRVTVNLINEYAQKGISVLILTSNISEAYIAGDKVILIKNGQVIGEDKNL